MKGATMLTQFVQYQVHAALMTIALFRNKKTVSHSLVSGKEKEQHAKTTHALLRVSAMSLAMDK